MNNHALTWSAQLLPLLSTSSQRVRVLAESAHAPPASSDPCSRLGSCSTTSLRNEGHGRLHVSVSGAWSTVALKSVKARRVPPPSPSNVGGACATEIHRPLHREESTWHGVVGGSASPPSAWIRKGAEPCTRPNRGLVRLLRATTSRKNVSRPSPKQLQVISQISAAQKGTRNFRGCHDILGLGGVCQQLGGGDARRFVMAVDRACASSAAAPPSGPAWSP